MTEIKKLIEQGKFKDAIADLREGNTLEAESLLEEIYNQNLNRIIDACYERGCLCIENQNYNKAIEHFNKIVALQPNHIEAYFQLGVIYFNTSNYLDAKKQFEKILKLDPNHKLAKINLGVLLMKEQV